MATATSEKGRVGRLSRAASQPCLRLGGQKWEQRPGRLAITLTSGDLREPSPGSKGQLDAPSLVGNFLGDLQATWHSLLWSQPASSTSPRKRMAFWLSDIAKGTGG